MVTMKCRMPVGICALLAASTLFICLIIARSGTSETESSAEGDTASLLASEGAGKEQFSSYDRLKKPERMSEEVWLKAIRDHELRVAANAAINFKGLVVDQYKVPVKGARVEVEILMWEPSFAEYVKAGRDKKSQKMELITDEHGAFSVNNKLGTALYIESLSKEGYSTPEYGVQYRFVYSALAENGLERGPYSDLKSPQLYVLWKQSGHSNKDVVRKNLTARVSEKDGSDTVYYRFSASPSYFLQESINRWDIGIKSISKSSEDWKLVLFSKDGGLQQTKDQHRNLAPDNGYKSEIIISSKDLIKPESKPTLGFYYKAEDGITFATFILRYSVDAKGRDFEVILEDLRVNFKGGNLLEYSE